MSNKNPGPKLFFSRFGGEQPIPAEFIAAMERAEEVQAVPNDVQPENLSDTVVESAVETNRTNERVLRTVKKKPGVITLFAYGTTADGQQVRITRSLVPTGTFVIAPATATAQAEGRDLGNGWTIQEYAETGTWNNGVFVPEVFAGKAFSAERSDVTPVKFRVAVSTETEEETVIGTATAPTLGTGDLVKTEQQVTKFTKRVRSSKRNPASLPVTITEKTTSNEGQLVTITETLQEGDTTDTPSATKTIRSEAVGDGTYVVRKEEVPEVFPAVQKSVEAVDLTPQKFSVQVKKRTIAVTSDGTITSGDLTLGAGEIAKTEQQVTEFVKRVTTQTRDNVTTATVNGKRMGTWGEETIVETLSSGDAAIDNPSFTPTSATMEAEATELGDGRYVKRRVTVVPDSFLVEHKYDPQTGIKYKLTKTLIASTSTPPTDPNTEIVPIDKWKSIQIVTSIDPNQLGSLSETFNTTSNFSYPDVLTEIGYTTEENVSGDTFSAGVNNISFIESEKLSWVSVARASAGAFMAAAIYTKITNGYRGPVQVTVTRTFHTSAPVNTIAVTKITPVMGSVTVKGKGVRRAISNEIRGVGDKRISSSGSGGSDLKVFGSVVNFGPVVHNNIGLTANGPLSANANSSASTGSLPGGGLYPVTSAIANASLEITLHLLPSSTPLNTGQTHIIGVNVEKWRFGIWVKEVMVATVP
jgi:hypothetical protein